MANFLKYLDYDGLQHYHSKLVDTFEPKSWIGTKAELNAAIAANEIEEGTIIYITDDEE